MEKSESTTTALLILVGTLLFLIVQVPWTTSNADVYDYAALAAHSTRPALNYHVGHGALLWLLYRAVPLGLQATLWPAGALSAVAVSVAAAATFLLWHRLGMAKVEACSVAIATLLIPSIWYHGTIGEVYGLQLCLSVLFALFFVSDRLLWAALAFFSALLVTPLSICAAPLVLLARGRPRWLRKALTVGAVSSALYLAVGLLMTSSIQEGLSDVHPAKYLSPVAVGEQGGRLVLILGANLIGFTPWLIRGWRPLRSLSAFAPLCVIAGFQLLMALSDKQFLVELGSFQLLLFWAVAVPLGLGITHVGTVRSVFCAASIATVTTLGLWSVPGVRTGRALEDAGRELRGRFQRPIRLIGPWGVSWPVALSMHRWDYDAAEKAYGEATQVSRATLEQLGTNEALVVIPRGSLRERLARQIPAFIRFRPPIDDGPGRPTTTLLFTNDAVAVHYWRAP